MIFLGFSRGRDIAVEMSRPINITGWTTPDEMILGCKYTPIIAGVFLMLTSVIFSTVLFINWFNKPN